MSISKTDFFRDYCRPLLTTPDHDSHTDHGAKASQSSEPSESVWMAHWKRTCSSKVTRLGVNVASENLVFEYSNASRSQQGTLVVVSDVPGPSNESKVEFEVSSKIANKLDGNSSNPRNGNFGQHFGTVGTSIANFSSKLHRVTPTEINFPSKDNQFVSKSISETPANFTKSYKPQQNLNLPIINPSLGDITRLASDVVTYGSKCGGLTARPLMDHKYEFEQPTLRIVSEKNLVNTNLASSVFLVHGMKNDGKMISKRSGSSLLGVKNEGLQLNNPTKSNTSFPAQGNSICKFHDTLFPTVNSNVGFSDHGKSKQQFYGTTFSTRSISPCASNSQERSHGFQYLRRLPTCCGQVEMPKMCATLSSFDELPSARARPFLTIEKSDVLAIKEDQLVKKSKLSTNCKQNAFLKMFAGPSNSFLYEKGRAEIQQQENSTDVEIKEKAETIKITSLEGRNESSAETDVMEIDDAQIRNSIPGFGSSPSLKGIDMHLHPLKSQTAVATSSVKVGSRKRLVEIPDINLEPPLLSNEESMEKDGNLNLSKTESLENPDCLNPNLPRDILLCHPSNGLAKRMKLNTSSSEADLEFCTLSHPWIQRWRNNTVTPWAKSAVPLRYIEAENSNPSLEEFKRKNLPSIAAMALMGKAVSCFQPCELRKKGPVMIW